MLYAIAAVLLGADETVIKLDPALVALATTLIIPLVVGLITKKYAGKAVKALTNAAAVAVVSAITLSSTDGLTLKAMIVMVIVGFLASSAAHEFIWKNLGVNIVVANAAPDFGIGKPNPIDLGPGTADMLDIQHAIENGVDPEAYWAADHNAEHGINPELRTDDPPEAVVDEEAGR